MKRLDSDLEQDIRDAVHSGRVDAVLDVLDLRHKPVPAPNDGACLFALFIACYNGDRAITEMLLDKGLNPDFRAPDTNWPALEVAATQGQKAVVQLLLDRGADVDVKNAIGWTPLIAASWKGQTEVVRLLLDRGANVNMKSPENYTAIVLAASANHPDTVKLLLDYGADRNVRDRDGWLPLDYANQKEDLSDPSYQIHARDPELKRLLETYFPEPKKKTPSEPPRRPRLVVPKPEKPVKLLPRKKGPAL